MTLLIETPAGYEAERAYVIDVIVTRFLGLACQHRISDRTDVRIAQTGADAGEIRLSDRFFSTPRQDWLTQSSLPELPLARVDLRALATPVICTDDNLPVLFGDQPAVITCADAAISLPIDIFGSAFFMLTRYEECLSGEIPQDVHGRFPASASLAMRAGFLHRPIVDEYAELLWSALHTLWPGLVRKGRQFKMAVSHDVDRPSRYAFKNSRSLISALVGDAKNRRFSSLLAAPAILARRHHDLHPSDPYNTFSWLMDQSDQAGITSAFYFIAGHTDSARDAGYTMEDPEIRALLRDVHARGHEIGLHPSYNTYLTPAAIESEFATLRAACTAEGISQGSWGGRMHYLRWHHPVTCAAWDAAGLTYDSTLGYAERIGFRCGTCHDYPAFDLLTRQSLALMLRPLIAMDCTVMSASYMGLGTGTEAARAFNDVKKTCKMFDGTFTLLWHNSELDCSAKKEIYRCLL